MADIMAGNFLTKAEGDDGKLTVVKFNNGTTKPMRHAKKFCLDEINRWQKSLHRLPNPDDWPGAKKTRPQLLSLETIDDLFGSFDGMIDALEKRKRPPRDYISTVKIIQPKKTPEVENVQVEAPQPEAENIQPETSEVQPESIEKSEENMAGREKQWTDLALAEIVHEACGDKTFISIGNYSGWRSNTPKVVPSCTTISKRLGNGRWEDVFPAMRKLLGLEEPALAQPIEPPMPQRPKQGSDQWREELMKEVELNAERWRWLVSRDVFINDIKAVASILGHQPTKRQYSDLRSSNMQSVKSILVHFGSWPKAMAAAGFDPVLAVSMPEEWRKLPSEESTLEPSVESPALEAPEPEPKPETPAEPETEPSEPEASESELAAQTEPPKPIPEKRPDELCLQDVRDAAAQLAPGEYLTTAKYNQLRPPGALIDKSLRDRFDCKWEEVLILADVPTQKDLAALKESASDALEPKTPEASETSETPALPFPVYHVVNLLSYDFTMGPAAPQIVTASKHGSVSLRTQRTLRVASQGKLEETREHKLVLEHSGHEIDFPEPAVGTVYLVDAKFYDAMEIRREDFIPVYPTQAGPAERPGFYANLFQRVGPRTSSR